MGGVPRSSPPYLNMKTGTVGWSPGGNKLAYVSARSPAVLKLSLYRISMARMRLSGDVRGGMRPGGGVSSGLMGSEQPAANDKRIQPNKQCNQVILMGLSEAL
jgi:hypothetical protein